MRIGELAKAAHCSVETIRYYEQRDLLPKPYRTDNNYRHYNESHLERLLFIRNCRSLDMTHEEIRALLEQLETPQQDCHGVLALLDEHIGHVQQRITELNALKKQLNELRQQCVHPSAVTNCGIVQKLTDKEIPSNHIHKTHLS